MSYFLKALLQPKIYVLESYNYLFNLGVSIRTPDKTENEIVGWYLTELERLEISPAGYIPKFVGRMRLKFIFKQKLAEHYKVLYQNPEECERELRKTFAYYRYL